MNRRSFFKSLAAGVVVLAAPKLLLPTAPPLGTSHETQVQLPPPRDFAYLDARAEAKADLAQWFSDQIDNLMYEALIA